MSLIDTKFQVDESKCVGCGLCQLACPSMPVSYTHLDVYKRQKLYRATSDSGKSCICAVSSRTHHRR